MSDQTKYPCCSAQKPQLHGTATAAHNIQYEDKRSSQNAMEGMIYLSGGEFLIGTDTQDGFPADGEGPVRKVLVNPFYVDECTVTNAQFKEFIEDTGYQTEAERFGQSFAFSHLV